LGIQAYGYTSFGMLENSPEIAEGLLERPDVMREGRDLLLLDAVAFGTALGADAGHGHGAHRRHAVADAGAGHP